MLTINECLIETNDFRVEDKIKKLEKRIHELVDEACLAEARGEYQLGLEKAKDASNKERSLIRMQEQAGLNDSHNIDLTFLVIFCFFFFMLIYNF